MGEKTAVPLYDFVDGIQGTLVEITEKREDGRKIKSKVDGLDEVVQYKYYPAVDPNQAPVKWLKLMLGLAEPKRSPRVYPKEAVRRVSLNRGVEDSPQQICVVLEDEHGDAPVAEAIEFDVERGFSKLQKKKDVAETEKDMAELENVSDESDEDDVKRGSRRGRHPVDETIDGLNSRREVR